MCGRTNWRGCCPGDGLRTLESLDLLARNPDTPGLVFATAAILLTAQSLTVCDRGNAPDGTKCALPPDVVYPAIFENTREFVDRLPQTPCEAMLDIGTGTGIAAMRVRPTRDTFGPQTYRRGARFSPNSTAAWPAWKT